MYITQHNKNVFPTLSSRHFPFQNWKQHTHSFSLIHGKFSVLFFSFSVCKQEISYDSPRGGVSVITEKGEISTSYLLIQRAKKTDSGKYVCAPSNANPFSITVHILNGKSIECWKRLYGRRWCNQSEHISIAACYANSFLHEQLRNWFKYSCEAFNVSPFILLYTQVSTRRRCITVQPAVA
jgi:hypothetical protein